MLPASAPARAGTFEVQHGKVSVKAAPGVTFQLGDKTITNAVLKSDGEGPPDRIGFNDLQLWVHMSGGRQSIRLRDKNSKLRKAFVGTSWFPIDKAYRVEATYEPYAKPKTVQVPNMLGDIDDLTVPGLVSFTMNGQPLKMEAVTEGDDKTFWFIFRDLTSGKETYPAARFLYMDGPVNGKMIVDFNRAENPPCAYNPYATCPLPPEQNRLRVRIEAGEKNVRRAFLVHRPSSIVRSLKIRSVVMADSKIIAVVGATGAQGGGLARAILNDKQGGFRVRALTRDVNSEKARALAAAGAEVVKADLDDVESVKRAFEGAHGAFCVTFYWAHLSPEKEMAEARAMAQAARHAGVKHAIWSTLEDTRKFIPLSDNSMPTLMGKYKVPHFDAKGESDAYFTEQGVPTTILLTSFYWDNFIYFGMGPKKGPDGKLALTLPMGDSKLPGMSAEDIGKCAYGIFKKGSEYIGKTVGIAGEFLSGAEMAAAFSKALGQPVAYNAVPPEVYRSFGFPGAEDLGNMFQFNRDFAKEFMAARSLSVARALNPALQTFDEWLAQNKSRIPLE